MDMTKKTRVAILGASGYTGGELVRILAHHPHAEIALMTADRKAGQELATVFPSLLAPDLPGMVSLDDVEWHGVDIDIVFCALPHGTTQDVIKALFHKTGHTMTDEIIYEGRDDLISAIAKPVRVIDLSADFRLENIETYAEWYGHEHRAPELQKEAVYGLTEWARDAVRDARLVANPGCYTTTSLLPLLPLLEAGLIEVDPIVIDAKSGVTGAGRAAREANLFSEVSEGMHAYGVGSHRHAPEIEQELTKAAGENVLVSFTPHLVPMNRGIFSTIYVRMRAGVTVVDLRQALLDQYGADYFVTVLPEGLAPATRNVRGSNHCHLNVFPDRVAGRAILLSVTDNLVKGASGQAVQNMNVMLGYDEKAGLEQEPLFP